MARGSDALNGKALEFAATQQPSTSINSATLYVPIAPRGNVVQYAPQKASFVGDPVRASLEKGPAVGNSAGERVGYRTGLNDTDASCSIERAQPPDSNRTAQKSKRKRECGSIDSASESYNSETVRTLISCLRDAGYGDKRHQHKSMRSVFEKAMALAERHYQVTRSWSGWQKKYNRLKKEYGMYVAKIQKSGRDGADPDLYDKPPFFEEVHELEKMNARHAPPAVLSSSKLAEGSDDGSDMSSTKKRLKRESSMSMEELDNRAEKRHTILIEELRKGNEHRAAFNRTFEKLLDKF